MAEARAAFHGTPAQLTQPMDQVPSDQHLLEQRVLRSRQDQHRDPPPHVRQVRGDDVEVGARVPRHEVEEQAAAPDDGREHRAAEDVPPRLGAVDAEDLERLLAGEAQQVQDEQHGDDGPPDAQQLVDEVEPVPVRRAAADDGRRDQAVEVPMSGGGVLDDLDEGDDTAVTQGDRKDDEELDLDLPPSHGANVGHVPEENLTAVRSVS